MTKAVWCAIAVYMAIIFAVSHDPTATDGLPLDFGADKLVHMVEFGLLAALWRKGLLLRGMDARKAGLVAFVVTGLYAAGDEWHQSFVPGRVCSVADFAADALGAALTLWFLHSRRAVGERQAACQ